MPGDPDEAVIQANRTIQGLNRNQKNSLLLVLVAHMINIGQRHILDQALGRIVAIIKD